MSTESLTGFRSSPIQQRLYALTADAPELRVQRLLPVRGLAAPHRVEAAARSLAAEHEILRTSFRLVGGQAVQVVSTQASPIVRALAAPGVDASTIDAWLRAHERAADRAARGLCDITIVSADDRQYLHVDLSPLVADRRSAMLIAHELRARAMGEEAARIGTGGPLQYADIAEWQHAVRAAAEARTGRRFWQTRGIDAAPRPFVYGRPPAERQAFAPARTRVREHALPATARALDQAAWLEAIALACWACACARLHASAGIVIGIVSDGRDEPETQLAIGPMAVTVPMAIAIDAAEPVSRAAERLIADLQQARVWQDVFDWDDLRPAGDASAASFCPLSFDWSSEREWSEAEPCWFLYDGRADTDRYELKLVGMTSDDRVHVRLDYDAGAVDAGEADQLLELFDSLFARAMASADRSAAAIGDGAVAWTRHRYDTLNDGRPDPRPDRDRLTPAPLATADAASMHDLFERQAAATPDAVAAYDDDGAVSYRELDRRASHLARYLRVQGIQSEARVGILLPQTASLAVALLGVLKAGGAFVPLDGAARERLRAIAATCRLRIVLTEQDDLDLPDGCICLSPAEGVAAGARIGAGTRPRIVSDQLAYVLFTSGSTGTPKGVMVPHGAAVNYLTWARAAYDRPGTTGSVVHTPLDFDFTLTSLFVPLSCGRAIRMTRTTGAASIARAHTTDDGATFSKVTPSHLRALRHHPSAPSAAGRLLVIGGEALRVDDLACLPPDAVIVNEYGPTEATVGCCAFRATVAALRASGASDVAIGRPIRHTTLQVLDPHGALAWPGTRGDLAIGGRGLARGYLDRPDLTAAAFRPAAHGLAAGSRVYRTGDDVRLRPDGQLTFLGRRDGQIKLHGFRIELDEIAHAARQFPAVAQSEAIVATDDRADARLVLFVTARPGTRLEVDELRASLEARLPSHMRPAAIARIDTIPLTPHGKVDREALARRCASSGPRASGRAPATRAERDLAAIWREVLRRDAIGADENFFAAGGDSIRALQLLGLAGKRGYRLTLPDLLAHPTIAALAAIAATVDDAGEAQTGAGTRLPFALVGEADRARLPQGLDDAYPMVSMQEGMLFHSEWDAQNVRYHDIVGIHVEAAYDRHALVESLREIVAAHPVLRTVFDLRRFSEPMQLVLRDVAVTVDEHDLSGTTPIEQEAAIDAWLARERGQRFAWSEAPPWRVSTHRRGTRAFQFSVSFHHALLDGWSTATLLSELVPRYASRLAAASPRPTTASPIDTVDASFRDYVRLERAARQSEEARAFWQDYLHDAAPTRYGREPSGGSPEPAEARRYERVIPDAIHARVTALAGELEVPLRAVLLAAHVQTIAAIAGDSDIVTGVISSGRVEDEGGDRALGLFLNTLPLRVATAGRSWRDLIQAIHDQEVRAAPHRRFPLAEMLRLHGATDLFDSAFNFVHYHLYHDRPLPAGVRVIGTRAFEQTSFALLASVVRSAASDRLTLLLDADTARVPATRLPAIADMYENALRAIATHPNAVAGDDDLLSARDVARLRIWAVPPRGAATATPPTLVRAERRVLEQARRTPDRVALVSRARQLSYRALVDRARRLAAGLVRRGVRDECVVALDVGRGADLITLCLATALAGAAYVYIDRALPAARRRFMLQDGAPALIVTDRVGPDEAAGAPVVSVDRLFEEALGERPLAPRPAAALDAACYVVYTSGSTGHPKGIVMSHRPVAALVAWQIDRAGRSDRRTLQFTTLGFDVSYQEIFATLGGGGALVLLDEPDVDDAAATWDLLRDEQVERLFASCPALRQLLIVRDAAGDAGSPDRRERLSLTELLVAGSVLQLTPDLRAFFADHPGLVLTNQYGPAETHVVTWCTLDGPHDAWPALPSLGRPVAGASVHVLDGRLRPVPIGSIGEIGLGGAAVSRGYHGRPDLTAARFVPDPQAEIAGTRLYRSGDLGRLDEQGALEFLGRRDHQIKVLGHRVELGEIDATIERAPGVAEAAVVWVAAAEGEGRLVAYVVPRGDPADARARIREQLERELPRHMMPASFVMLDALPKTIAGKLDRRRLPRAPGAGAPRGPAAPAATDTEALVLELWANALQRDDLGVEDDFFEAGGHSLTATRIAVGLRARFQVDLTIRQIYQLRTVRRLAAHIAGRPAAGVPVPRVPRDGTLRLARQQAAFWYFEHVSGQIHANNIHAGLRLAGPLNEEAVAQAAALLRRRHEALRTAFVSGPDGEPAPVIAPPDADDAGLLIIDLSGLPEEARERTLAGLSKADRDRPFDLARGRLGRFTLVRVGASDHVLLFTTHHLVCDGWSMDILTRELSTLYDAAVRGLPAALPDLPFQYVDFVDWQEGWLAESRAAAQVAHWTRQLAPPLPDLLPDEPATAMQVAVRRRVPFLVDAATAARARQLAQETRGTPFAVFLTIWKIVLANHAGQSDVRVATYAAARGTTGAERIVGLFSNLVCLRSRIDRALAFRDQLRAVQSTLEDATANQDVPYTIVSRALHDTYGAAAARPYQVLALWHATPAARLRMPDIEVRLYRPEEEELVLMHAPLDLKIEWMETPDALTGCLSYTLTRFAPETIDGFIRAFDQALAAVAHTPSITVGGVCEVLT